MIDSLFKAIADNRPEYLQFALNLSFSAQFINVSRSHTDGNTLLHKAFSWNRRDMIDLLLSHPDFQVYTTNQQWL